MNVDADLYAPIEWDPERFGIGVKQIDDQHRQLLKLINSLAYHLSADARHLQMSTGLRGVINNAAAAVSDESNKHHRPVSSNSGITPPNQIFMMGESDSAMMDESMSDRNSPTNVIYTPTAASRAAAGGKQPLINRLGFMQGEKKELEPSPATHLRNFPRKFQAKSDVGAVVDQLVTYAIKTLGSEDHLLETYGYGEREMQVREHAIFSDKVCRVHRLMESYAAQVEDLTRLLKFLKMWIGEHVRTDRRYAPLLIEKGAGV